jgi:hypothetical protein
MLCCACRIQRQSQCWGAAGAVHFLWLSSWLLLSQLHLCGILCLSSRKFRTVCRFVCRELKNGLKLLTELNTLVGSYAACCIAAASNSFTMRMPADIQTLVPVLSAVYDSHQMCTTPQPEYDVLL